VDLESTTTPLTTSDLKGDVTCLTYDSTDSASFEYVARIYLVSCSFAAVKLKKKNNVYFTVIISIGYKYVESGSEM
jgi:hypothetical protein